VPLIPILGDWRGRRDPLLVIGAVPSIRIPSGAAARMRTPGLLSGSWQAEIWACMSAGWQAMRDREVKVTGEEVACGR